MSTSRIARGNRSLTTSSVSAIATGLTAGIVGRLNYRTSSSDRSSRRRHSMILKTSSHKHVPSKSGAGQDTQSRCGCSRSLDTVHMSGTGE